MHVVYLLHRHEYPVADLKGVLQRRHAIVADLADVEQALFAGQDFDEDAEGEHPRHGADEGLARLNFTDDVFYDLNGHLGRVVVDRRDADSAAVLDVDLGAGLLDYAADRLSAGADDVADLFRIDIEGDDLRSRRREFGARGRDRGVHYVQYLETSLLCLREGLREYAAGDAARFVVHLQRRYAVARAGDFEVHIAVVVFKALNVGEDANLPGVGDESHRDAGDGLFNGNAGRHHRKAAAAYGGHRAGTVRFQDIGNLAHDVRE